MFLDETWATTAMVRTHGRAPRGERLVRPVPAGHWRTTTFVCGLRHDGLVAPLVLDRAVNGAALGAGFGLMAACDERMLAPALEPGDLVVLDNLSSHKVAGVRQAVEARGASLLYLPPYSPDLNPIEQVFSKLKRLLRTAAARTVDALWDAIGQLLDRFSPAECARYLRHCGYTHPEL